MIDNQESSVSKPCSIRELANLSSKNRQNNERSSISRYFSSNSGGCNTISSQFMKKSSDNSQNGFQSNTFLRNNDSVFMQSKQFQVFNDYFIGKKEVQTMQQITEEKPKLKKDNKTLKQKLNRKIKEYSKIMDRVFLFLEKLFSQKEIDINKSQYGELELYFIKNVLNKKTKIKIKEDFTLKDMIQLVQQKKHSQKRFEENFKMVLKLASDIFEKELASQTTQFVDQDYYLNYYFKDVAKNEKLSLEEFKDPSQHCRQKGFSYYYNSLNNEYLGLLMRSKKYAQRFKLFLENELVQIYCQNICKKFKSMKKFLKRKLREKFIQNKYVFSSECFKEVIFDYFNYNKQCKIPWSIHEVQYAQRQLLDRIDKLI